MTKHITISALTVEHNSTSMDQSVKTDKVINLLLLELKLYLTGHISASDSIARYRQGISK